MRSSLFLVCLGVVVLGVAMWTGTPSWQATAGDKIANDDGKLVKGDPKDDAIQKRFGKPDRVTGSGRVLRYDLRNGDTLIVSGGRHEFRHYDLQNGDTLILIVSGGKVMGVMHQSKREPAKGDLGDAIQKRFGMPNRLTGSGRAFLHYELPTEETLTFVVSGGEVIGAVHEMETNK